MSYTHTVVITLGRTSNRTGKPLDEAHWNEVKRGVRKSLRFAEAQVVQCPYIEGAEHDQLGVWGTETEEACAYVALIQGYHNITKLRRMLACDAEIGEQTCIGCIVTIGTDHLVYADG